MDESFGDGKSWKIASAFELGVDAEKDIYSGSFVGMFPFFSLSVIVISSVFISLNIIRSVIVISSVFISLNIINTAG